MNKEGMVKEISGRRRHRIFSYHKYLEIISEEPKYPPSLLRNEVIDILDQDLQ